MYQQKKQTSSPKININKLNCEKETKIKYQNSLKDLITPMECEECPQNIWEKTKEAIKTAALASAGEIERSKQVNRTPDKYISKMSNQQKQIRLQLMNITDIDKRTELKQERNKINHIISKRALQIRNQELDTQADEIEDKAETTMMYKAVRALNRKKMDNPKVQDDDGKLAATPDEILEIITAFFKDKFQDPEREEIHPFQGPAKRLKKEITPIEVEKSLKRLNNNRAAGGDEIPGELLKHGAKDLSPILSNIFNDVFGTHQPLDINNGQMITLPKPGKPKGPKKNLRPVTVLDGIRKSLSLITLDRIRPKVESYLSHSQSGFRPARSTSDIVWAHRWLAAKVNKSRMDINITGIDMSAAFDTVDRHKLLDILKNIIDEDELRIIRFLLSNTTINIKINGATKQMPFNSNVGVPQGDGLSPVLFTVYLEAALREVRKDLSQESKIPNEMAYADDVDFVTIEDHINIDEVQRKLSEYNLLVNSDKTEYTKLNRKENKSEEVWRKTKKVGSLIGDSEDVNRRKDLSTVAMNKMFNIWIRKDRIKLKTRVKLYKALVKSVLLYNSSTWGITKAEEESLNAFHRKQLRRVLGVHCPTKITNKSLYKKTNEKPISDTMREARWMLFGHILRRNSNIPANVAMRFYFEENVKGFRGRPRTTLPVVLNQDLENYQNNVYSKNLQRHVLKLKCSQDLMKLSELAQNRERWRQLVRGIVEAGEASSSVDEEATLL